MLAAGLVEDFEDRDDQNGVGAELEVEDRFACSLSEYQGADGNDDEIPF